MAVLYAYKSYRWSPASLHIILFMNVIHFLKVETVHIILDYKSCIWIREIELMPVRIGLEIN